MQQLVIQFPLNTSEQHIDELHDLIALEVPFERISDERFVVDGRGFGAGKTNIFIFAADAKSALDSIKAYLPDARRFSGR